MSRALTYEEKLELIRLWKEEQYSLRMLCEAFNTTQSVVERWKKRYSIHGPSGLKGSATRSPYTAETRNKILNEYKSGVSKKEIVAKYQMSNSTLSEWMVKYGCMKQFDPSKAIEPNAIKELKKKHKDNPEMLELLDRLEYSEMENACLKKLATLVQARKEKGRKQSKD